MSQPSGRVRSQLSILPREQRVAYLAGCIRRQIAESLNRPDSDIPTDATFESLNGAWTELHPVYELLKESIEEQIGRKLYLWELSRPPQGIESLNTIQTLSEAMVEDMDIPTPDISFTDPFEGGRLAWELPGSMPNASPRNPPAMFLLSSPRAGSTLLRVMLEGHPDLFSPPELCLLMFESMANRKRQAERLGYSWMCSGLRVALMELEGLSEEAAQQRLKQLESNDVSIQGVYRMLQTSAKDRLLVDKTPGYALHLKWLKRGEELFKDTKYLCLVRHPYAVIESIVRMRFPGRLIGNHWGFWDDNPWICAEKWWVATYRTIVDFFNEVNPARQHWIRYEDLVATPQEMLTQICDFLRIPFDQKVLNPYDSERMTTTGGDPNFKSHERIDPSLATAWRDKRPPHRLSNVAREIATKFGYALDENP